MRLVGAVLAVLLACCGSLQAQKEDQPPDLASLNPCPKGGEALAEKLHTEKTCESAAKLLDECRWGSSADTDFAPIVISKCEKRFVHKMSHTALDHYGREMQICGYRRARAKGSISISEAAMCQVSVSVDAAQHPAHYRGPAPRASFDCSGVTTPLRRAICSNRGLGTADIVLARAYQLALVSLKAEERPQLEADQREWRNESRIKCGFTRFPAPKAQLDCLRSSMEERFTRLDGCSDSQREDSFTVAQCMKILHGGLNADLEDPDEEVGSEEEVKSEEEAPVSGPRASFDCENPQTALQFVICADADLGRADLLVARVLEEAKKANVQGLKESQALWLRFVTGSCPLGAIGGIPSIFARGCVGSAYEARAVQIRSCIKQPPAEQRACLNDFHLSKDDLARH